MAKRQFQMMPFNTSDWLKCPELKVLPPDLKGLWMDLLCYMWESVERGVMVKPNGTIYSHEEIVRLVGTDAAGSDTWLDRLIFGGVCSEREDGAIYCRRMVKDAEISRKRREAGLKGGSATKSKVFAQKPPESKEKPKEPVLFPQPDSEPTTPPPLTPEQQAKAEKAKKYKYADNVTLKRDEYAKLCEQHGEEAAKRMIEILNLYKGSSGKRYKSDYMTILNWVVDRYYEEIKKYGTERKAILNDNRGCFENNQRQPERAIQTDPGANGSGEAQASKDYSERF